MHVIDICHRLIYGKTVSRPSMLVRIISINISPIETSFRFVSCLINIIAQWLLCVAPKIQTDEVRFLRSYSVFKMLVRRHACITGILSLLTILIILLRTLLKIYIKKIKLLKLLYLCVYFTCTQHSRFKPTRWGFLWVTLFSFFLFLK